MCTYFKNNPAKFYPDLIWNDEALGFFEECCHNKSKKHKKKINKMSKSKK